MKNIEAIVVGVSAGGFETLSQILPLIPPCLPPIIIVQHLSSFSDGYLAKYYSDICRVEVLEVEEREGFDFGNIYIAPSNYHVLIENDRTFTLTSTERVNFARPSIDVLFESAADVFQKNLIGIILSGANKDGSFGLNQIKQKGGKTIVQDPQDAISPQMPISAINVVCPDYILPHRLIISKIIELTETI